jgi:hypothetical protein
MRCPKNRSTRFSHEKEVGPERDRRYAGEGRGSNRRMMTGITPSIIVFQIMHRIGASCV